MTKQILLSLLNCSWQWMLLSGLIWFVASSRFHKRRCSNTTVHLLWLLSLLSLPLLFGLNQFVPAPSIGGDPVPELGQTKPINVSGLAALTTDLSEISLTGSDIQSKNQLLAGGESFFNWIKTDLLLYLWAIGALAMLVRFMFGLYRIYQLRRSAVAADDSYQVICQRLARQLNINRPVTVCLSDRIASPISFGWLSPYILIPQKLNLEQFELVAAHELAHVQRLDWLTNLFSHMVGVIFFFHPIYHFLNRELVHLRERICDDWVIQLTGSRKNYAQCLLDLVRHRDKTIPLALSLNQPSQLESRIDAILKSNRRLDVQLKPHLRLIVATLLLTCLPLLAMAQLVPLKTFQVSLFAQTPEKSEEAVDKTAEKQDMKKANAEKMGKKEYEDKSYIKVEDPSSFEISEENRIFSGPQPGEKLPSLNVTGVRGETDGKTFDITTKVDGKPLVLFLQDTNAVGVKGFVNVSKLLLKIDAFQKRHSKATGDNKSTQGLQIGVVFLADNLDTLPDWAHDMLNEEIPNEVLTGISLDGREGPGSYGLNRNVAQTILIAKDGKVLHNFALTQPMLYSDPHFLGAVADAIGADAPALEKWLNDAPAKRRDKTAGPSVIINEINDASGQASDWMELRNLSDKELNMKGWTLKVATTRLDAEKELIQFNKDLKIPANGVIILDAESLKKLDISSVEGEKLLGKLNKTKETSQKMDRRQYRNQRQVKIADPAAFSTSEENKIFSGPQPGEKLPPLNATSIVGESDGKTLDFIAKSDEHPLVLFLQDGNGAGLERLYEISRIIAKIADESKQELHVSIVFLGDDPDALKQRVSGVARVVAENVSKNILLGISSEGREGPGNYGLNRNVSQTILVAKNGKVLHNFAFTQPTVYADPHVLGAIANVIGEDPAAIEKWLNEEPADEERMQRDRRQMDREDTRDSEQGPSHEELVKRFDKDGDGKLNREEGMAARRALANRERGNSHRSDNIKVKNPAEFKKIQEKEIFSGPQPGEKLPPLNATSLVGASEGKTFDFIAKSDEQPIVLFLQGADGAGLRGLYDISRMIAKIANESKQELHVSVVFLGDDPDALKQRVSGTARGVAESMSNNVLLGISPEGREGPGNYGLNRNVEQTILIAKDGKVLHNFAFTQPTVYADPHVLGAIAHVLGADPAAVEEWLNEEPADEERMQRDRQRMERKGARNSEQEPSREELAKRLDKEDSDFEISLADAIRNGDIEAIKQHIADGVDVNELFFETHPLAWAALMGQTEAAALLLQHGANINGRNRDGNTALHCAVFLGNAETAELLLKNEADVNAKNLDGSTPVDFLRIPWEMTRSSLRSLDVELKQEQLEAGKSEIREMFRADAKHSAKPNVQDAPTNLWTAARVGNVQAIKRYIKEGGDVNALDREFHLPAMSWGALHGQTEVVRVLIKSGADVNRKSGDDNTPLHSAAFFGRTDIAKLLLKNGADIKARNDDGITPADALYVDWQTTVFIGDLVGVEIGKAEISAMKKGRFEVAKLFGVEDTYAAQNLLEAAFIGDLAAVKQALTDGGAPNARDLQYGTTVLATAALMGHTKAVAMLLEHGADVNAKSREGSTALHAAAFLGHAETVRLLLEKGADATIRNNDGATPLDVTKADWEITEYVADQLQIEIDEVEINIGRSEVVKLITGQKKKMSQRGIGEKNEKLDTLGSDLPLFGNRRPQ